MISGVLFKRNMKSCIRPLLIVFAVLCMYTAVIIYMYQPELAEMLSDYQEALPEMMAAVGMTGAAESLLEWIQIYLYGFIMMLFPLIFTIIAVQKLMMGWIDSRAVAGLLAAPLTRRKLAVTQAVSCALLTALLIAAVTAVGAVSSAAMFPGELDIRGYVILNAGTFLMQLLTAGIAFCAACFSTESKYFYGFGAGLPLLFFLLQMASNMGEELEFLKYGTVYTLLPAQEIARGEGGYWGYFAVMAAAAVLLFGVGIRRFETRDLSV